MSCYVSLNCYSKENMYQLLQKIENKSNILWRDWSTPTKYFPREKYLILDTEGKYLWASNKETGTYKSFYNFIKKCKEIAPKTNPKIDPKKETVIAVEVKNNKEAKKLLTEIEEKSNICWQTNSLKPTIIPNKSCFLMCDANVYIYIQDNNLRWISKNIYFTREQSFCFDFVSPEDFVKECINLYPKEPNVVFSNGYNDYLNNFLVINQNLQSYCKGDAELAFSLEERREEMNSEKVTMEQTMTSCIIGILAPMATKENTSIFRDEKKNRLFIEVAAKENEAFKDIDFSFKEEISLDERYSASTCICTIENGTIILRVKTREDIQRVEIS